MDSETALIGRDYANWWLEDGEDGATQRGVYHYKEGSGDEALTEQGLDERVRPVVGTGFHGRLCHPPTKTKLQVTQLWVRWLHGGQQGVRR